MLKIPLPNPNEAGLFWAAIWKNNENYPGILPHSKTHLFVPHANGDRMNRHVEHDIGRYAWQRLRGRIRGNSEDDHPTLGHVIS